jgi:hypothetical protein
MLTKTNFTLNYPNFTESEGSLACIQQPITFPALSQITPVHNLPSILSQININIIIPSMSTSHKWSFSFRVPHQNVVWIIFSPIRATFPVRLILQDCNSRIVFGEIDKSLSSTLCSFLNPRVTSGPLVLNIFCTTQVSNTLSPYPPSVWETKIHIHKRQQAKL